MTSPGPDPQPPTPRPVARRTVLATGAAGAGTAALVAPLATGASAADTEPVFRHGVA